MRTSRSLTDVSALGGVHALDFGGCGNISDVSALGGVHTLDFGGCGNITDVSASEMLRYIRFNLTLVCRNTEL